MSQPSLGLLIIRIVVGVVFIWAGVAKLLGGEQTLTNVGSAMGLYGITFLPLFWGIMAAVAETVGGLLFALGALFRVASAALAFTMFTATVLKLNSVGWDLSNHIEYGWPLTMLALFVGMIFMSPGRYSLQGRD